MSAIMSFSASARAEDDIGVKSAGGAENCWIVNVGVMLQITLDFPGAKTYGVDFAPQFSFRRKREAAGSSTSDHALAGLDPYSPTLQVGAFVEVWPVKGVLRSRKRHAVQVQVDAAALCGSGTLAEPRGVVNSPGSRALPLNGALANHPPLVQARTKIKSAKAPNASAFILHPQDKAPSPACATQRTNRCKFRRRFRTSVDDNAERSQPLR